MIARKWLVAGGVVVALVVARIALVGGGDKSAAPSGRGGGGGPTPVSVFIVATEPVTDRVTAIGTIRSNEEVQIRSEVSGKVQRVLFREGARVNRGDLLIKLDDSELRAQLARAQARLNLTRSESARQEQLFADSLTSVREFETASNAAEVADAEVKLIRAQMAKTEIRAPFDGVIGLRSVSEGSYVTPTSMIASLQDQTPVKIDFTVPERYAARIKTGDRVRFRVEGIAREFDAEIYARDSGIDPGTRALRVRATYPNEDGALVTGAFAHVELAFDERTATMIPTYTLVPELKGHRVFLLRGNRAEARSVEVGTRTDEQVEIVNGLAAGDTLIASALLQLKDGARVRLADDAGAGPGSASQP